MLSRCVCNKKRSGVHDLLVPPAHQRVEVVGGVLLPELAQHLLLVPRLDAHHDLCLCQNSMVFRVSSSSQRELPHGSRGRRGRRLLGFGLLRLGLVLALPLPRFFGATGCAAGRASSLAAAGSAPTSAVASAVGWSGRASASAAAGASLMLFFLQSFLPMSGPSSSAVQLDAEAQAGAAQVDHVALVVSELEAQKPSVIRPLPLTMWFSWVSASLLWPTPCLQTILAMMSWPSGPTVSAALARLLH